MKLKFLLSYFIDFIDLFYLYKEHKEHMDWTIGPLDYFLDYFLDHFIRGGGGEADH